MAVNNLIQIRRSASTATPTDLNAGELAYSNTSQVLFVGSTDADGAGAGTMVALAGVRNPGVLTANQALVANSTSYINDIKTANCSIDDFLYANTALGGDGEVLTSNSTGGVYWSSPASSSFTIAGDTGSDTMSTGQTLTFTGDTGISTVVSNNEVTIDLDDTAVVAGVKGSASVVPVFTVDQQGRITAATNTTISITESQISNLGTYLTDITGESIGDLSDVTITGAATGEFLRHNGSAWVDSVIQTGDISEAMVTQHEAALTILTSQLSGDVALGTGTSGNYVATITGGTGVSSTAATTGEGTTHTLSIGQAVGTSDDVTFNDVTVSGDLTVNGTTTTINTATLAVEDPLILLATNNNTTDTVDIGLYGLYDTSGSQDLYGGFFRDANDSGKWKLFKDLQTAPTTTVNTGGTGYAVGTLVAHLEDDSVSITGGSITGITDLAVADGGTGAGTFTTNGIIYGNSTSALQVTAAGTQYQVLQAGASGVPEFGSLDGGTF